MSRTIDHFESRCQSRTLGVADVDTLDLIADKKRIPFGVLCDEANILLQPEEIAHTNSLIEACPILKTLHTTRLLHFSTEYRESAESQLDGVVTRYEMQ